MSPSIPVSRTKVVVPARRAELLSRPRLLDLMYELLDKRLILISAPAGYGKTSLLIDLAHHSDLPLCWLSLDSLDQDPQRFIACFIASLAQRFPQLGRQSSAALDSLASLEDDMERLIVTLVNEIYDQVHEHFIFVLDDYHLVDNVPAIQNFINRFVQMMDENCHLIISSRTLIVFPDLSLMVARDQLEGLSLIELAFQVNEIQALFEQVHHLSLSETAARELVAETEGWITGLQLSNLTRVQGMADRLRLARASGVGLFDYLGQQVLDQQPLALRDFLLCSSLLGEFDAELCAAVLGPLSPQPKNWQELIKTVLHDNLFVLPVGVEGQWLRYHHLFQDFLQARLKQERPDQVNPILYRLAQVYEQRGEWEKARHVYQTLDDVEALADMIERAEPSMVQTALLTLGNWLDDLPPPLLKKRPRLLSLRGNVACLQGDVQGGLSLFDHAEVTFRSQADASGLAVTLVRRAIAHGVLGDYKASLQDADEALQLTEVAEALQAAHAEAQRVKGLTLHRLGQVRQALEWLERSLDLYSSLDRTRNIPALLMETGMAYRAIGKLEPARLSYEKALAMWQKEGSLTWQANLLNNLGVLHHTEGNYVEALSTLEQGLDCARRSGYARMEAMILASMGDVYTDVEELDTAQQAYQQADEISQRISERFLINYLSLAQAGLARLQKNFGLARQLLDRARAWVSASGSAHVEGLLYLESGRLRLAEDDFGKAVQDLQTAAQHFARGGLTIEEGWSRLWLAAACNRAGERAAAQEQLQIALQPASLGGAAHSLSMVARQACRWLEGLQDETLAGRALGQLLWQSEQQASALPQIRKRLRRLARAVPISAPRLTIKALGRAQVKVNGRPLAISQWQTQEARNLFFYFLARSQPATKEEVGLAFWPDLPPAQLRLRFKTNMYRLRRALGQNAVLFEKDCYRFDHSLDYDCDVHEFDDRLVQAHTGKEAHQRIKAYQSAVELVQGPYLADIDADWVLPERSRIEQAHMSALIRLAELYLETGAASKSLESCQRALAVDGCLEEAYRLAMRACAALGDRPAVARQYQACKENLRRELNLPPSPETEELYRRLTA